MLLDRNLMPQKVESVENMVTLISNSLSRSKKQLKTLILIGHGCNACISVGCGQQIQFGGNAARTKALSGMLENRHIGLDNLVYWKPEFEKLRDYCADEVNIIPVVQNKV